MIKVYSSTNCSGCKALKTRLDNWNITYETVDIATDGAAKEKLISSGFRTVPQLEVDGVFVKDLLKLSKEDLIE